MFSCPKITAPIAENAGIRAENILALAIPKFLIALTQRTNAIQEHRMARDISGTKTSVVKKVWFMPSSPYPKNNGKK